MPSRYNVVQIAEIAFWTKVTQLYPEVESGDFPPEAAAEFTRACEEAVKTWLICNAPVFTLKEEGLEA